MWGVAQLAAERFGDNVVRPEPAARLAAAARAIADVGAGDGKYALRLSRAHPDALVVAIDADASRLAATASRLKNRAPDNLAFWVASLDRPLLGAAGGFDEIHVVMPWGSLLEGVLGRSPGVLDNVLGLGAGGARLVAVVNQRPWAESAGDRRVADVAPPDDATRDTLRGLLAARGWELTDWRALTGAEAAGIASSWARRVGSARAPLFLRYTAARGGAVPA